MYKRRSRGAAKSSGLESGSVSVAGLPSAQQKNLGYLDALSASIAATSGELAADNTKATIDAIINTLWKFRNSGIYGPKESVLRLNRQPQVVGLAARLRTVLPRMGLAPLTDVYQRTVNEVFACVKSICEAALLQREYVQAEALVFGFISSLVMSSEQLDELAAIQSVALLGTIYIGAQPSESVDVPEPAAASMLDQPEHDDGRHGSGSEPEAVPASCEADSSSPLDVLHDILSLSKGTLTTEKMDRAGSSLHDLLEALTSSSVPAAVSLNVKRNLIAAAPTWLRKLFTHALLPWPRVSPREWAHNLQACQRITGTLLSACTWWTSRGIVFLPPALQETVASYQRAVCLCVRCMLLHCCMNRFFTLAQAAAASSELALAGNVHEVGVATVITCGTRCTIFLLVLT